MYELEILRNLNWEPYLKSNNIEEIDEAFLELIEEEPTIILRYLVDDRVLGFFHTTEREYLYWKQNYANEDSTIRKCEQTRVSSRPPQKVKSFPKKKKDKNICIRCRQIR